MATKATIKRDPIFLVKTSNGYVGRTDILEDGGKGLVDTLPRPFAYCWDTLQSATTIANHFGGAVEIY